MDAEAAVRAEKAEVKRRAAMWAALDRKRGMGWSVEVETASRPVMPVGMSSMRLSLGTLRLGEEGLEGPEGPTWAQGEEGEGTGADGKGPGGGAPGEGRKEGRGSRRLGWKKTDKLECFGVGAVASNAVVFGNGLVDGGGDVE